MLRRITHKTASEQRTLMQLTLLPLQQLETYVDLPQHVQVFEKKTLAGNTIMELTAPYLQE